MGKYLNTVQHAMMILEDPSVTPVQTYYSVSTLISRGERKTIVTDIFMNSIFSHIFVPFCDVHVPLNFH